MMTENIEDQTVVLTSIMLLIKGLLYTNRKDAIWRPQGDSNPCYRRERAVS